MVVSTHSAAVLTVSDSASKGNRRDTSGDVAAEFLVSLGAVILAREVVSDDREIIAGKLRHFADGLNVALVLTTGGTGFGPRDVTPEATRDVLDREAPGLAEVMRRETSRKTPLASLSRAVTGLRGRTLIVNLPGSPEGVAECLSVLKPSIGHGLDILRGVVTRHDEPPETD